MSKQIAHNMLVPVTKLYKTASFSYRDLHRNNLPKLGERLPEVFFSNISVNAPNKYLQCDKRQINSECELLITEE